MSFIGAKFFHLPPFHIQTEIHICDAICKNLSDVAKCKIEFFGLILKLKVSSFLNCLNFVSIDDIHLQCYN